MRARCPRRRHSGCTTAEKDREVQENDYKGPPCLHRVPACGCVNWADAFLNCPLPCERWLDRRRRYRLLNDRIAAGRRERVPDRADLAAARRAHAQPADRAPPRHGLPRLLALHPRIRQFELRRDTRIRSGRRQSRRPGPACWTVPAVDSHAARAASSSAHADRVSSAASSSICFCCKRD